ncbi:MAG: hypothetical protein NC548_27285 [Lachnospiraceae bacterium]|nr:hypothetical protein [Lachnospiraceae bacterium]
MMEELLNILSNPINQLITLGLLLVVYALAYSGRVMAGKRRTTKQQIPWSWKRFWNDLAFRLGVIYSLVTVIIVMDILSWILSNVEQPMAQAFADVISLVTNVGGILALPLLASLNEVQKTIKLQRTIWRYQENLQELGVSETDVASLKIDTKAISTQTQEVIKDIVEYWAPPVEPEVQKKDQVTKKEAREAIEESQMGTSILMANVLEELKGYAAKQAFLKEDGTSGIYRGQCTQVPSYVYNQLGVVGAMGNGKDVVKNLIARGVAEPCGEEPGAIASADNGSEYGHTWLALGNGYLIEQNVKIGNVKSANYGAGTVYSVRVGRLNEFNRGKITYCRLKGLQTTTQNNPTISEQKYDKTTTVKPAANQQNSDTIEYVYKAGDTFGQVIVNLGLKTSHGLWGADGDVAYYTKQLNEQGIYGNIPIGATIKLTRRK